MLFFLFQLIINILIIIILIFFCKFLKNFNDNNPGTKSSLYGNKLRISFIIFFVIWFILQVLIIFGIIKIDTDI